MKRLKLFEWLIILLVAIGAGPAASSVWQWSTTSATNATADPTINWAEGMSPSSVNDSGRAMMSAVAKWRDDGSGSLTSSGTTSAITLVSGSVFTTSIPNNTRLVFFHNVAGNAAGATLNVDGLGAFPIYENGASISSDRLQIGGIYTVTFYTSVNRWYLQGIYNDPFNVPLGGVVFTTLSTAPNSNFIAPYGQCISTTTYAVYWVAMGSPASGACPGGQFAVIDLRGRAVAGLDTLPGSSAASRMTNAATGCGVSFTTVGAVCTESQSTTLVTGNLPAYTPAGIISNGLITISGSISNNMPTGHTSLGAGGADTNYTQASPSASQAASGFTGTAQGGTSTPFSKVQPTMGLVPWLRVI